VGKQVRKKLPALLGNASSYTTSAVFSKQEKKRERRTEHNCLADVQNEGGRIRSNTHPIAHFENLKTSLQTLVHNQDRIGITMCIQTCNNIRM
jgi:hypothetical protein